MTDVCQWDGVEWGWSDDGQKSTHPANEWRLKAHWLVPIYSEAEIHLNIQ